MLKLLWKIVALKKQSLPQLLRRLVKSPRLLSLRFLSALLHLRRLVRQSALLARSFQAVKLHLRRYAHLMLRCKREVLWQKSLFLTRQPLLLFQADLPITLRFSQSLKLLLSSFWEKIFPHLL